MQPEVKSPWLSSTNYVNFITFVIGLLSLSEFGDVVPQGWTKYILLSVAALNLVLRNFFTSKPTTEVAARKDR